MLAYAHIESRSIWLELCICHSDSTCVKAITSFLTLLGMLPWTTPTVRAARDKAVPRN